HLCRSVWLLWPERGRRCGHRCAGHVARGGQARTRAMDAAGREWLGGVQICALVRMPGRHRQRRQDHRLGYTDLGLFGLFASEYHEPKHGGEPGSLVTAELAGWEKPGLEEGFGGASNNVEPVYTDIPNRMVKFTYLGPTSHRQGPLRIRVGSMRGVGSPDNIFAAETFMDELAVAANADALEFRLKHKPTERMQAVFKAASERAN